MEFFSPVCLCLYKTWLLVILRLAMGLTLWFCVLAPTSDCRGLDILQPQACSATCLGSLWFVDADQRPCEQERKAWTKPALREFNSYTLQQKKQKQIKKQWMSEFMGLKAGIQFVSAYLQQKLMDPSSQPWQLTQAIAQKYIQHKQLGPAVLISTPRCRCHLFSFYSSLLLGLRGANKRRGVQFSTATTEAALELG